jgi:MFS transporter, DHA2 family, multidrug resistance protein
MHYTRFEGTRRVLDGEKALPELDLPPENKTGTFFPSVHADCMMGFNIDSMSVTEAAMFFIARVINRVDNRMVILFGFLLTALSMWQMTQFSLQMGMAPVIISGLLQGFGLGCTFVPLNIIALSNLPRHILTQGTAIRSLMRNLGGSIGISVLVVTLAQNTQVVHSRLAEGLRPDNPLAQAPYLAAPFSLTTPGGIAALNAEVTRRAAMVGYIDDFKLMMLIALASTPLLLLLRDERRRAPPVAVTATANADD